MRTVDGLRNYFVMSQFYRITTENFRYSKSLCPIKTASMSIGFHQPERIRTLTAKAIATTVFGITLLVKCTAQSQQPQDIQSLPLETLRQLASHGDGGAENEIGNRYDSGKGVVKDYAESYSWYRKAAKHGNAPGEFNLAYAYDHGRGTKPDLKQAVEWYRKAAEQGNAGAANNLGTMYHSGRGVPLDLHQDFIWKSKAAESGNVIAQVDLGTLYLKGEGVQRDSSLAAAWFAKAANQGSADAQAALGDLYRTGDGVPHDLVRAITLYNQAAVQDNTVAQVHLGEMYLKGLGIKQNYLLAQKWLEAAFINGDISATVFLAELDKLLTTAPMQSTPGGTVTASSGPSLQQTVAFINTAFNDQGKFLYRPHWDGPGSSVRGGKSFSNQRLIAGENCHLTYLDTTEDETFLGDDPVQPQPHKLQINATVLDPRTISIHSITAPDRTTYFISVASEKPPDTEEVGAFDFEDRANRVAKAYVHLLSLCYKEKAPSLF
jgi:TPR repeat protein